MRHDKCRNDTWQTLEKIIVLKWNTRMNGMGFVASSKLVHHGCWGSNKNNQGPEHSIWIPLGWFRVFDAIWRVAWSKKIFFMVIEYRAANSSSWWMSLCTVITYVQLDCLTNWLPLHPCELSWVKITSQKIMVFSINMYGNHNKLTFIILCYVVTYIENSVECR